MRGFKLLLATGAVGLFMTGTAIAGRGLFQSIPRRGGPFQRGCGAGARRVRHWAAVGYAQLPVSFVSNEGQTDARVPTPRVAMATGST